MKYYDFVDEETDEVIRLTKKQIQSIENEKRHILIREAKKQLCEKLNVKDLNDIPRIASPKEYRELERNYKKMSVQNPERKILEFRLSRGVRKTNRKKSRKKV